MKSNGMYWVIFTVLFFCALLIYWTMPRPAVMTMASPEREATLIIDPGHGGEDGGAVSCTGHSESNINLSISLRLSDIAVLSGVPVKLLRETDTALYDADCRGIKEKKRSDLINRAKAVNAVTNGILVSIHQNQFSQSRYHGAQVFYSKSSGSERLAALTQNSFRKHIDTKNHRKEKLLQKVYLLEHTDCPAILVECGFLSNPEEEKLLMEERYQIKLALSILQPVYQFRNGAVEDAEI